MANTPGKTELYRRGHGSFYESWRNMRRRCNGRTGDSEVNRKYHGSGISYVKGWDSFGNFFIDMYPYYQPGLTIDRKDNLKGYSPENCRWVDRKVQANNRNTNRRFTIDGSTKTLAEWIDTTKLKSSTVRQRFYVYKWSIEKSLGLERG